jgi:hypothetical protein
MNRWQTVAILVLLVLVGAMGLRNVVLNAQPAMAIGQTNPVILAGTSAPVPPEPHFTTASTEPLSGTSAPVPPEPPSVR